MKTWTFAAVSALALAAGACQPKAERALARLDCPAREGSLSRVSQEADGKSCLYKSAEGAEVRLRLIPVSGDVEATLASLEAETLALRGAAPAARPAPADNAKAEVPPPASNDDREDDDVDIRLPGLQVRTEGDSAKVNVAGMHIDAGDDGATIRNMKYVRLRGEATATEKRGVRAMFIRASDDDDPLPSVGYQAAGPRAGPIAAAIVKWSSRDNDEIYGDVRKLVRDNGGA